jgi:two-component system chemotaxis response regulator CheB
VIRVLVVDDSSFMRTALSMMLEKSPDIEVVGKARDGQEALELVETLDPDVLTMDIEMPRMDGLTALRHIMKRSPRPVLMISSLTQEGADVTIEALSIGAVDFIPKEHARVQLSITEIEGELHQKVKAAAHARRRLPRRFAARAQAKPSDSPAASPERTPTRRPAAPAPPPARALSRSHARAEILVIGVSTGGPLALQEVIPALPASLPVPVAVVQHMPPHFTRSLAERLDTQSALHVCEAEDGMPLEPGRVLIARGGEHLSLRRTRSGLVHAVVTPEPSESLHRPSVDVLFRAAADVYGRHTLALVMTGMGKDGLLGAKHIRARGGGVLAQDEATCVVYGMPRAVTEAGVAEESIPLPRIAETLTRALERSYRQAEALR